MGKITAVMDRKEHERNDSFPHGYEPLIGRQAEAAAADDGSFGGKKQKKTCREVELWVEEQGRNSGLAEMRDGAIS